MKLCQILDIITIARSIYCYDIAENYIKLFGYSSFQRQVWFEDYFRKGQILTFSKQINFGIYDVYDLHYSYLESDRNGVRKLITSQI
jgi:hypothetical protein